jgi:hypothetical protein
MRSRVPEWRDAVARLTLAQTPTNDGDVDGRPGDRVAPFAIGPFARKGYGVGAVMILAQQLDPSPRRRRILPEFAQTMLSCRHLCSHVEAKAAFAAPGWRKGWEHSTQRNFNGLAWQTARAHTACHYVSGSMAKPIERQKNGNGLGPYPSSIGSNSQPAIAWDAVSTLPGRRGSEIEDVKRAGVPLAQRRGSRHRALGAERPVSIVSTCPHSGQR